MLDFCSFQAGSQQFCLCFAQYNARRADWPRRSKFALARRPACMRRCSLYDVGANRLATESTFITLCTYLVGGATSRAVKYDRLIKNSSGPSRPLVCQSERLQDLGVLLWRVACKMGPELVAGEKAKDRSQWRNNWGVVCEDVARLSHRR
jgi:hypothetical protein